MAQHGLPDPERGAAYAARERAMLIEDFKRNRPTVVLVDNLTGKWGEWLQSNPDVAELLKSYRLRQTVNGIDILSE